MNSAYLPGNLEVMVSRAERILLLQGPVGGFFHTLGQWLQYTHGRQVFKINFNGGDEADYPPDTGRTFAYRDGFSSFAGFLEAFLAEHRIQAVVCFGDTRPYHCTAKQVARTHGADFWAFEEGYFRPYFVTLERDGVNDYSSLPRTAEFFLNAYPQLANKRYQDPLPVPAGFWPSARAAIRYYWHANLKRSAYPNYIHHRELGAAHYLHLWADSAVKRLQYWYRDRHFAKRAASGEFGRFFILPLQVFNDSQVRVHSDFPSVRDFLLHVLSSFAAHAPQDTRLIVKHHPMDRGFIDYKQDIADFCRRHPQCRERIFYIHDVPLPVLLRHGIGMVTLNSTSGLSALIHHMPVKTLGRAAYDIPGLTDQADLASFWRQPAKPDPVLFHAYRQYHVNITQINGSFYSRVLFPDWTPAVRPSESSGSAPSA